MHDRPTSCPAPSGLITNWSLSSGGTFADFRFTVTDVADIVLLLFNFSSKQRRI
jgi:hypothetical protein